MGFRSKVKRNPISVTTMSVTQTWKLTTYKYSVSLKSKIVFKFESNDYFGLNLLRVKNEQKYFLSHGLWGRPVKVDNT